jgi:hypothetical protein
LGERLARLGPLDTRTVRDGGYRQDHLSPVQELHAAFRTGQSYSRYMYGYGTQRSIDLSAFDSPQLWPLLEEAARLGLTLIHAHPSVGELPRPEAGELVLDVTREGPERFGVGVWLPVGGAPAEQLVPVGFIGRLGHGIVCGERAEVGRRDRADLDTRRRAGPCGGRRPQPSTPSCANASVYRR